MQFYCDLLAGLLVFVWKTMVACFSTLLMTQDEDCNGKDSHSEEDVTSVIQTVHYLYIQVSSSI